VTLQRASAKVDRRILAAGRPPVLLIIMSTRARLVLATLFGLALGLSLSLAGRVLAARDSTTSPSRTVASAALPWDDARLLAEVIQRVRENYVDSVDDHKLMQNAIRGMVEALDDHSTS